MSNTYFNPIINKKESKKRKRLNRLVKNKKLFKRASRYSDSCLLTGEVGVWQGVSWVRVIVKPRALQKRGKAYWSNK